MSLFRTLSPSDECDEYDDDTDTVDSLEIQAAYNALRFGQPVSLPPSATLDFSSAAAGHATQLSAPLQPPLR